MLRVENLGARQQYHETIEIEGEVDAVDGHSDQKEERVLITESNFRQINIRGLSII